MSELVNDELINALLSAMREYERAIEAKERPTDKKYAAYCDARNAVLSRMRPQQKLNTDVTPEIVAMLDGSAAREDEARWLTDRAITMASAEMQAGRGDQDLAKCLTMAHQVLKLARKQVADAKP